MFCLDVDEVSIDPQRTLVAPLSGVDARGQRLFGDADQHLARVEAGEEADQPLRSALEAVEDGLLVFQQPMRAAKRTTSRPNLRLGPDSPSIPAWPSASAAAEFAVDLARPTAHS